MTAPAGLLVLAALTAVLLGLMAETWIAFVFALGFAAAFALARAT